MPLLKREWLPLMCRTSPLISMPLLMWGLQLMPIQPVTIFAVCFGIQLFDTHP